MEKTKINLENALFNRGTTLKHNDLIIRVDKKITVMNGRMILKDGDKLFRNDKEMVDIVYPHKRKYKLKIGDIVERKLKDGDVVLLNRQPTLHKASMQAQEIILRPYKTIRMNLAITKGFNADFDGDEMNIHVPQSLEAQAELRMLSASKYNIISPQSSKPIMAIVQDSLLAAYRMSLGTQKLRKEQFYSISMKVDFSSDECLKKIQHIRRILKEKGKKTQCFNGKGLISLILPKDLIFEKKNNANPDEPVVKIYRGVLYEGTLDKTILGSSHNSLIHIINKEYSPERACEFIDHIQFITNEWILIKGFSVGLGDCLIQDKEKKKEIENVISKCFMEAEGIKTTTNHPSIRELRILSSLNKAKDIGLRIAKETLKSDNNFLSTVYSGSKGDFFNIAQITGLLGQQNLKGQRINPMLNNNTRSLPHYSFDKLSIEDEYESRGFISSCFIDGLNPKEFYFHAMSGREGVCDTAMGTATSGYMQRRIIKLTEDIKIQYDGTVRDTTGKIYQMCYGDNGLDPSSTIKVDGKQQVCNITRLVDKLNMKHEIKSNK